MSSSIRRRTSHRHERAESEALSEVAREAELRLAAKRQARAEAREIRMRELERQQIEEQEKKRTKEETDSNKPYVAHSFRKEYNNTEDIKTELWELQEKYSKSMSDNARLDIERRGLRCRLDDLSDHLDELKENKIDLVSRLNNKKKELDMERKAKEKLETKMSKLQQQLDVKDALIKEHGLVFISDDLSEEEEGGREIKSSDTKRCALVSSEALAVLEEFSGSMDERVLKMDEEIKARDKLIRRLKTELDAEKNKKQSHSPTPSRTIPVQNNNNNNNPSAPSTFEAELSKQLDDFRFKLKKSNQEILSLQDNVTRLEKQVKRHKSAAEAAEKGEEELKSVKRSLTKEVRALKLDKESLEMENMRLQKRIDKLQVKH